MKQDLDWRERFRFPCPGEPAGLPEPEGMALLAGDVSPRKVYVELTTECNMNCGMCVRHTWDSPGGVMSRETFGRVLTQIADLPGAAAVNFSGYGEPMSHPHFLEFVSAAKRAGLIVETVTNGALLDDEAIDGIVELGLDRLVVSVDGLTADSCQMLHAGSFADVGPRLRRLYHVRLSRGQSRPEVALEFVATKRNIHELPKLKALSLAYGFSGILVTNLIPHTRQQAEQILYDRYATARRSSRASPANPCVDLPLMDGGSSAAEVIDRLRRTGTYLRSGGTDAFGAAPRCRFVTEGRLAVRWDGSVSPCLPLMHSHRYYFRDKPREIRCYHVGTVDETPLSEIWLGAEYRAFRDRVRRFDFSPCIDCGGCDLRLTNEADCSGSQFPRCGECLWAAGLVQCP